MSENPQIEILSRFADIASIAGVRGKIDEELALFAAGFELEEGRSQMVFARALPEAVKGQDAVCIYSPCRRVKKGFMRGFSKDDCLELLRLNSELLMARYGVIESEEEYLVMASVDIILDTLDAEEVEASFWFVAIAADDYEKKFGSDEF